MEKVTYFAGIVVGIIICCFFIYRYSEEINNLKHYSRKENKRRKLEVTIQLIRLVIPWLLLIMLIVLTHLIKR